MNPGIVLFTLILVAGGLTYYYFRLKHIETIARIEHGIDTPSHDASSAKRLGWLLISIGIGIAAGYLLGKQLMVPFVATVPTAVLVAGGVTLLLTVKKG